MVVSIGGPVAAVLTSLGSVVVASIVGAVTVLALDRLRDTARRRRGLPAAPH
jgi:hypothetical protein